jgi:hypothetical protein
MYLLIENQYFGPVISYSALIKSSHVDFCEYEPYRKAGFRNRCTLPGANGLINLSVPITGGRDQKTIFREVKIDNSEDWQKNHWRTIFSVYGKSPFFNFFSHELESLYQMPFTYLFDWNIACFEWAQEKLQMNIKIQYRENWPEVNADIFDLRNRIMPSTINQISPGSLVYTQVFAPKFGFQPGMSILDLICCEGKNAREILLNSPVEIDKLP